jgi:hypothetical protein
LTFELFGTVKLSEGALAKIVDTRPMRSRKGSERRAVADHRQARLRERQTDAQNLLNDLGVIERGIRDLKDAFKQAEDALKRKAAERVEAADRLKAFQAAFKIGSAVLTAFPVGKPYTDIASGVFSLVGDAMGAAGGGGDPSAVIDSAGKSIAGFKEAYGGKLKKLAGEEVSGSLSKAGKARGLIVIQAYFLGASWEDISDYDPLNIIFTVRHSGASIVDNNGTTYEFVSRDDKERVRWSFNYDWLTEEITPDLPDPMDEALFKKIFLKSPDRQDSSPAAPGERASREPKWGGPRSLIAVMAPGFGSDFDLFMEPSPGDRPVRAERLLLNVDYVGRPSDGF